MTPAVAPRPVTDPVASRSLTGHLVTILYILLCFEIGLLILFVPWTAFWAKNFFVQQYAWVGALARNNFVRGAISGTGLADVWLAIYEISRYRRARRAARGAAPIPE